MKTERRHELETNDLADWLGHSIERTRPYFSAITAGVVAVVVIVGAVAVLRYRSQVRQAEGWDRYQGAMLSGDSAALEGVATEFSGTPVGVWARLQIADTHLINGTSALFSDREQARSELLKAVDAFKAARDETRTPLLAQRAWFGLARAHESLDELDRAREAYQAIIDRWPESALAEASKSRLDDIERDSTKRFYDWFAQQSPSPITSGGPGDADGPLFDPRGLPDDPGDLGSLFTPLDLDTPGGTSEPQSPADAPTDAEPQSPVDAEAPLEAESAIEGESPTDSDDAGRIDTSEADDASPSP